MRAAIITASAAIPAAVWATWPTAPAPLVAKTVMTEGVREARLDTTSFRARWREMPPATVIQYAAVPQAADTPNQQAGVEARERRQTASRSRGRSHWVDPGEEPATQALSTRRARLDICQRHRMHKVFFGRRWRCRR